MLTKKFVLDAAERVVATFVEAFAGLLVLAGPVDAFHLSALHSALAAGGIAVLAVLKSVAASFLNSSDSASLVAAPVPVEKVIVPNDKLTVVSATAVKKTAASPAKKAAAKKVAVKKPEA